MIKFYQGIKPVRTSERTKAQIVCEKELELYPYLIYNPVLFPGLGQRHIEFCACVECYNAIMRGIQDSLSQESDVYKFDDPTVKL